MRYGGEQGQAELVSARGIRDVVLITFGIKSLGIDKASDAEGDASKIKVSEVGP